MDWFNLVDNKITGHIIAYIQNLVLSYNLDKNNIRRPQEIAAEASIEWQGKTNNWGSTSSSIWCPLIWKALALSGMNIPHRWICFPIKDKIDNFDALAKELSQIPGWARYAEHILNNEPREPAFANKFHNNEIGDPNYALVARYYDIKINHPELFT